MFLEPFPNFNFGEMASPRYHATSTQSTGPSERLRRFRDGVGATQDAYLDQYLWYEADKRARQCPRDASPGDEAGGGLFVDIAPFRAAVASMASS